MTRVICPFCLTIILIGTVMEGETCPECELGVLADYTEYLERIRNMGDYNDRDGIGPSLREES